MVVLYLCSRLRGSSPNRGTVSQRTESLPASCQNCTMHFDTAHICGVDLHIGELVLQSQAIPMIQYFFRQHRFEGLCHLQYFTLTKQFKSQLIFLKEYNFPGQYYIASVAKSRVSEYKHLSWEKSQKCHAIKNRYF